MLTYITHIVVCYLLFWKVCRLVSKVCWLISSIGMIERELVCWLTSPRFIFALSHKSMLTWITHGCVWNTLTYSMLTYITHIVVCYLFEKSMLTCITNGCLWIAFKKYVDLYHPCMAVSEILQLHSCVLFILKSMLTSITYACLWSVFDKYVDLYHPWVSLKYFSLKYADLHHP